MVVRPVGSQTSCMAEAQVRGCNLGEVEGKVLVE